MPNNEDIAKAPESYLFKSDQVEVVPFNTELLIATYGESFASESFADGRTFYTEKRTWDNDTRPNRYIASKATFNPKAEQNLYSLESPDIWRQTFTEEDFNTIAKAGMDIKFQMQDPAKSQLALANKREIDLKSGEKVTVELVPYSIDSSTRIMKDLGTKNDVK
jgi:hypothetical protein